MASGLTILVGGLVPAVYGSWLKTRSRSAVGHAFDHGWPGGAARSSRAGGGAVRTSHAVARRGAARPRQPRPSEPSECRGGNRSRADGRRVAVGARLRQRVGSPGVLGALARADEDTARRPRRGDCGQPSAERSRPNQQLRSRGPSDAAGAESAAVHLGRCFAGLLRHRRPPSRTRTIARRAFPRGRCDRCRSSVGRSLLPRYRGAGPQAEERRLYLLPVDDRGRSGWHRQMDGSRRARHRYRLLPVRRHAERLLRVAHNRRSSPVGWRSPRRRSRPRSRTRAHAGRDG